MFRDKEEELQRLSRQLREEVEEPEEWTEEEETPEEPDMDELLQDDARIGDMTDGVYRNASNGYGQNLRNFASGYKAYNGDKTDVDLDALSQEVRADDREEKSITGLVVTALVLAATVVGVLIYWLVRGGLF